MLNSSVQLSWSRGRLISLTLPIKKPENFNYNLFPPFSDLSWQITILLTKLQSHPHNSAFKKCLTSEININKRSLSPKIRYFVIKRIWFVDLYYWLEGRLVHCWYFVTGLEASFLAFPAGENFHHFRFVTA
jgi:hypothetical protein